MLLNVYRENQPYTLFTIPIVAILFWINGIIDPVTISYDDFSPLYRMVSQVVTKYLYLNIIVSVFLVTSGAVLLNLTLNRFDFYERENYLPSLFYTLAMSFELGGQTFNPILISNIFLILVFRFMLRIKRQDSSKELVFNAGILTAIGTLFYMPFILVFFLSWLSLSVLRPFVWREWILAIIGFMLPFLLLLAFTYLMGWYDSTLPNIPFWGEASNVNFSTTNVGFIRILNGLCMSMVLLAFIALSKSFTRNAIRFKKQVYIVVFFTFLIGLGFIITYYTMFDLFGVSLFAVPIAIILPYYFYYSKRRWFSDLIYYIALILLIVKIFLH